MPKKKSIFNQLHSMDLHDELRVGDYIKILRVMGGWIYSTIWQDKMTSVFIPLSQVK